LGSPRRIILELLPLKTQYSYSKRRELIVSRHGVTSHGTCIVTDTTAVA